MPGGPRLRHIFEASATGLRQEAPEGEYFPFEDDWGHGHWSPLQRHTSEGTAAQLPPLLPPSARNLRWRYAPPCRGDPDYGTSSKLRPPGFAEKPPRASPFPSRTTEVTGTDLHYKRLTSEVRPSPLPARLGALPSGRSTQDDFLCYRSALTRSFWTWRALSGLGFPPPFFIGKGGGEGDIVPLC